MVNHNPHLYLGNSGTINILMSLGSNGINSLLLCLGSSGITNILMGIIINGSNNNFLGYLGNSGITNIPMGLGSNGTKCSHIEKSNNIPYYLRGELITSFLLCWYLPDGRCTNIFLLSG
jgi:hypothetical protein